MTMIEILGKVSVLIILLLFSTIMSRYDIKNLSVPNWPYWAGCIFLIIAQLIFNHQTIYLFLISALIFTGIYFLIRIITKGHLGMGDVYFGFFQGLCLRPQVIWICFTVETVTAFIVYIIYSRQSKAKNPKLAFIPFMSLGLLTAFLIDWIFN